MTELTATREVKTEIKRTTTIMLTPDQVADALRIHYNTPATAEVKFECGYTDDYLEGTQITWTETE